MKKRYDRARSSKTDIFKGIGLITISEPFPQISDQQFPQGNSQNFSKKISKSTSKIFTTSFPQNNSIG